LKNTIVTVYKPWSRDISINTETMLGAGRPEFDSWQG